MIWRHVASNFLTLLIVLLVAAAVAVGIGVVFGVYPASRAARRPRLGRGFGAQAMVDRNGPQHHAARCGPVVRQVHQRGRIAAARQGDPQRRAIPGNPQEGRRPPSIARGPSSEPAAQSDCMISRMSWAVSDGVLPTFTPAASRASFLACAVPAEPETMAPAWPMVLPSGAVKPAT